jgi:hypothetical protein
LLDPRYRFSRPTADRLGRLRPTLRRVAAAGLRVAPLELGLVALLADQAELVAHAALGRLGLAGEPRARVERALAAPPAAVPPRPPRARAARLRALGDLGLAAWWLRGDAAARRAADWYVTTARPVRPVLRGDDLLALGVPAGPELARVLEALRDARLDGAVADRDGEAAYVRDWVEQSKEG